MVLPAWLLGCSSHPLEHYHQLEPKLDLFTFFEGKTHAWGQFQARDGSLKRRFTVDITGTVKSNQQQDTLILDERFSYDDGEKEQRIWTITKNGDSSYTGKAADVIGSARGIAAGPALHWSYSLNLPYKDSTIAVDFDDWMFLQDEQTMINRAIVSKWGFKVGEVTLFFKKSGEHQ